MISEASAKDARDMEQLVDQGLDLLLFGKAVKTLRDYLDHVMGGKIHSGLQSLGQAVTAGDDPAAVCSAAPDCPDAMRMDVIPSEGADDPENLTVNLRRREIFQTLSSRLRGTINNHSLKGKHFSGKRIVETTLDAGGLPARE